VVGNAGVGAKLARCRRTNSSTGWLPRAELQTGQHVTRLISLLDLSSE
jgi:hypothetical protein